jgi:hypothetical protein
VWKTRRRETASPKAALANALEVEGQQNHPATDDSPQVTRRVINSLLLSSSFPAISTIAAKSNGSPISAWRIRPLMPVGLHSGVIDESRRHRPKRRDDA